MENMAEAFKIAFAVLMFVIALTLSISSFSQAKIAVDAITAIRDNRTEYVESDTNRDIYNAYITPSKELSRTVGVETVVSTMYRSYEENIEIYFFDASGDEIELYYKTKGDCEIAKDASNQLIALTSISLEDEDFGGDYTKLEKVHFDLVLGNVSEVDEIIKETLKGKSENAINKCIDFYQKRMSIHPEGLYEFLKGFEFEELLGEYTIDEGTTNEKTIRVITYTIVP